MKFIDKSGVLQDLVPEKWFRLLEKTTKEVSGIDNMTLETLAVSGGFVPNEHHYAGTTSKGQTEFNLRVVEEKRKIA